MLRLFLCELLHCSVTACLPIRLIGCFWFNAWGNYHWNSFRSKLYFNTQNARVIITSSEGKTRISPNEITMFISLRDITVPALLQSKILLENIFLFWNFLLAHTKVLMSRSEINIVISLGEILVFPSLGNPSISLSLFLYARLKIKLF
jgi:hypothetical protein